MTVAMISLRALARERTLLLFTVAGLAAVLAPLMVLYGLKFGVVSALLSALRDDPRNREIQFRGNYGLDAEAIEALRALPGAAFVIPAPRTIAARMTFETQGGNAIVQAGVSPTEAGDPLVSDLTTSLSTEEVVLSSGLARRLGVRVGDDVIASNARTVSGGTEPIEFALRVRAVLEPGIVEHEWALLAPELLARLEAFLDGYAVPGSEHGGRPLAERPERYETVRFYAASLEDVARLDEHLSGMGYTVFSRAADVRSILALDRNLALVFTGLASIASLGYAISLAASLAASFEQKRRHVGLLRLCGASRAAVLAWPATQGLAITICGFTCALVLYGAFAVTVNSLFAGDLPRGAAVCRLEVQHFVAALAGSLAVVALVVAMIGKSVAAVSPAEALRQE